VSSVELLLQQHGLEPPRRRRPTKLLASDQK
jgi:hypothetical protein